ncbi:MAG: hypothetical protein ACRDYV_00105 [Acidimicrobiia bacterium]
MITTTQVALAFGAILAALLGAALLTLIGMVRGDLADVKKNTDQIPTILSRLDRLETERSHP